MYIDVHAPPTRLDKTVLINQVPTQYLSSFWRAHDDPMLLDIRWRSMLGGTLEFCGSSKSVHSLTRRVSVRYLIAFDTLSHISLSYPVIWRYVLKVVRSTTLDYPWSIISTVNKPHWTTRKKERNTTVIFELFFIHLTRRICTKGVLRNLLVHVTSHHIYLSVLNILDINVCIDFWFAFSP